MGKPGDNIHSFLTVSLCHQKKGCHKHPSLPGPAVSSPTHSVQVTRSSESFLLRPKWAKIFETSALGHHYPFIRIDKIEVYLSSWAGLSGINMCFREQYYRHHFLCVFLSVFFQGTTSELSVHERVTGRHALTTGPLNTCPSIFLSRAFNKR